MTTTAILFLLLASGEAGDVSVPAGLCRDVPAALERGEVVSVDIASGARERGVLASCFTLTQPVGDCEWDGA